MSYNIINPVEHTFMYVIYYNTNGAQKRSSKITTHETFNLYDIDNTIDRDKTTSFRVYADEDYTLVPPFTIQNGTSNISMIESSDTYGTFYGRGIIPSTNDITISGQVSSGTTIHNVTLTNNIANTVLTSDKGISNNITTSDAILTLTPKENYFFGSVPQININGTSYNFTKDNNNYILDLNTITINVDVEATITGNMYLKIQFNLTNVDIYEYGIQIYTGNNSTIVGVTVPSGRKWNNGNIIINYDDSTSENRALTLQYDATHQKSYYGVTLSFIDSSKNISSIVVTASADVVIGDNVDIQYTLLNCIKSEDSPTTIENNATSINKITINSTSGFIFKTVPTLRIVKNSGSSNLYNFTLSDDNKIAELEITDTNLGDNYITTISVNAVAEAESVVTIRGFQNVYKMTRQQLNQLAQARYITRTNDYYYQRIDLGKYIIALCEYPFDIEGDEDSYIILGDEETEIIARRLNNYEFEFTSEKKLINGLYKDSSDISKSNIKIYLPYYGYTEIDSKYINTEINIKIIVNVLTNTCIYNIFSNDLLIESIEKNIADKLPYITQTTNDDISIGNSNVYVNMNENKLFVLIEQYSKVNDTHNETLKVDLISNLVGFIKGEFSQGLIIPNAKSDELQMIQTYFNQGVYC